MKKLPLGIQTFSQIIEDDLVYVDKTGHIVELVDSLKYVFLSRPRRFGKSLLLSTIEEFFTGKRELFAGLKIYDYPDWKTHPIIRLDFSNMDTGSEETFRETFFDRLNEIAGFYGIEIKSQIISHYFGRLIKELSEKYGEKTVILIDEYDKPITDHLDNPEVAGRIREFLKSVFVRMKGNDAHIRFALLTGVSKFSKVSLFSGMNQITDISMNENYASLLGYTQEELQFYFSGYIDNLAEKKGVSRNELLQEIKRWYNGYSWDAKTRLYNPFSILSLFSTQRFDNYWFSSGTPSYLVKLMKEKQYDVTILKDAEANILTFDSGTLDKIDPINLLFQTGYLTVSEKRDLYQIEEYLLNFPNFEVETSFYSHLIGDMANTQPYEALTLALKLRQSLEKGNIGQFESILRTLFAQIPSNLLIQEERFFHSLFIMISYLSGIETEAEVNTNIGRIDGVIEFMNKICIVEFKYNHPALEGLEQILQKKYYEKYLAKGKEIILLGVSFSGNEINTVNLTFKH